MKVLVVEDEHRIASYIKKGLELKAWIVDTAFTGTDGFDLAATESYDVIVLDRMLPEMDGLELCKKLRNEQIHTPILMLTARSAVEERVEGLEAGADDYLGKPFAFTELLARLKALARRPRETIGTHLSAGDLVVDSRTFTVTRGGVPIELSRKEFALLEFFLRNQKQVFSKEQLSEQVWSYDDDVLPNTAQVYIGYLRNKIDRAFPDKPELIQTVRGFGYKLEAPHA